ncbi:MAG: T9SS type A sorting domain-containing protein [Saprospiraceae bacterium]|nr:T9SS type A sorting domain-containing protein [Saprospiraceae bacterium]
MLLLPSISKSQSADTLVCDNGGFEDGLTYYTGQYSDSYRLGGNICTPLYLDSSITWNAISIPAFRRFEIVNNGPDTLTGINKVKFGYKSLLLNNRYGHFSFTCSGHYDVNKIVKRFKVTPETRDFTVWYAAILENPNGHRDQQPWFSISCDRDPANNLCFDASQIECYNIFLDSICTFDTIKLVNWACHTFKIPLNMLDSIATLEITAADCGEGGHFTYAYIDGICELCDGSAFGSGTLYQQPLNEEGLGIDFDPCGDDSLTICGSYTLPAICGAWKLDSILPVDFNFYSLSIDTANNKYCFKVALADFTYDSCTEIYLKLYFSSNTQILDPVYSNTIEVCPISFEYELTVVTGSCQNNNTTSLLSDDYYYVQVDLDQFIEGDSFLIERVLDDPYPNETGHYDLLIDTADGIYNLGPFFIQEGDWKLIFSHEDCRDTFNISAPHFCSGTGNCILFNSAKISNVMCYNNSTSSVSDDSWSFQIKVNGIGGSYSINGSGSYSYNTTHTYYVPGTIGLECVEIKLSAPGGCEAFLMICPPKPCSDNENCELEVYLDSIFCNEENATFYVYLNVFASGSSYVCYSSFAVSDPGNTSNSNYYHDNLNNPLGPFDEDVYLIISTCNSDDCSCDLSCFKLIYIPNPDCENLEFRNLHVDDSKNQEMQDLIVVPNPISTNEIQFTSKLKNTSISLFSADGKVIWHGNINGPSFKIDLVLPQGLYFIKYKNRKGKECFSKVIKY